MMSQSIISTADIRAQTVILKKWSADSWYRSIERPTDELSTITSVCCCDLLFIKGSHLNAPSPTAAKQHPDSSYCFLTYHRCSLGIWTGDLPARMCPTWNIFSLHPSVPIQLSPVKLENKEWSTTVCLGESVSAERRSKSHHSFFMVTVNTRLLFLPQLIGLKIIPLKALLFSCVVL